MAHLTYETLLNYLEGHLSAAQKDEADAHLNVPCDSCQRRRLLLQNVLRSAEKDQTIPPPPSVLKSAIDIPLTHPKNTQPGLLTRLVAALTFDSHLQLSSALTRGAARERQMLFSADQVDIDLQIKSTREGHDLIGQILGGSSRKVTSAFVNLQKNTGQLLKATEADRKGQFVFRGLPAGMYDLIFDLENQEVAVMGIEVRND
jgi:hypothetical protein